VIGANELEGDLAVELRVVGRVDHAHAARAEPIENQVAPDERAEAQ
jgi:hypothetical protein